MDLKTSSMKLSDVAVSIFVMDDMTPITLAQSAGSPEESIADLAAVKGLWCHVLHDFMELFSELFCISIRSVAVVLMCL